MMFVLIWGVILLIPAAAGDAAPPCDDFDTSGCVSNPSLCQDPVLSLVTCPKTCNKCPFYCYNCNSVINVTSCTNITTCPSDMVCNSTKRSLHERNVQKFCCADNYCNHVPTMTTPVTMATQPMVQSTISSTARLVTNCNKDVIFIMEESNRVPSIEPSRKFMLDIVAGLDIGPNASLVALLSHNDLYYPVGWSLTKYPTKTSLLQAISLTQRHPWPPNPDPLVGIQMYLSGVANGQQGNRPDKEDVVIIMTTAEIPEHFSPLLGVYEHPVVLIAGLNRQSNNVIWIGIGPGISDGTLFLVTKDSNHRFHLSSVYEMPNVSQRVADLICP
ncbi:uncharacterized protein LOC127881228 isoform X2 [Dreissena polymorpha]|uniref:VWFA domain-containing protein n=1 Tax=Dreissena polymorpha TaxID=45954 RepID=A0A9D4MSK2_DREPO|nr:uncharacterized protein LOC127881228 isoform X2 [Dreissena polymorpha]KAH3881678.1 hypothetical protein DPMN_005605 [Dreissena polymorpha]